MKYEPHQHFSQTFSIWGVEKTNKKQEVRRPSAQQQSILERGVGGVTMSRFWRRTSESLEPLLPPPPLQHHQHDEDQHGHHQHGRDGHHHLQASAARHVV